MDEFGWILILVLNGKAHIFDASDVLSLHRKDSPKHFQTWGGCRTAGSIVAEEMKRLDPELEVQCYCAAEWIGREAGR